MTHFTKAQMLLITFGLLCISQLALTAEKVIWEGNVDKLKVRWTGVDITATDIFCRYWPNGKVSNLPGFLTKY